MSQLEILPKPKSLLLEPVLKEAVIGRRTDALCKLAEEPVQYSWQAFAIFIFLLAMAFVTAGRALALA